MNIAQFVLGVITLIVIGVSAYGINMFFGLLGVGLLGLFVLGVTVPIVWYNSRSTTGTSTARRSKGASKGRE